MDDLASLTGAVGTPWMARWRHAEQRADVAIAQFLAAPKLTEPGIARTIADNLDDASELVVASSMPVRDLEWFGGRRARARGSSPRRSGPGPTGRCRACRSRCGRLRPAR
jgi:2-succinyl-5-enolpyruvyl-6-hydroxy-3-cyclohexene-1-carboxylate synthase